MRIPLASLLPVTDGPAPRYRVHPQPWISSHQFPPEPHHGYGNLSFDAFAAIHKSVYFLKNPTSIELLPALLADLRRYVVNDEEFAVALSNNADACILNRTFTEVAPCHVPTSGPDRMTSPLCVSASVDRP